MRPLARKPFVRTLLLSPPPHSFHGLAPDRPCLPPRIAVDLRRRRTTCMARRRWYAGTSRLAAAVSWNKRFSPSAAVITRPTDNGHEAIPRYRRVGGRSGDGWADSTVGGLRRYGGWPHCESFVMNSSRDPLPTECEEEAKGNTRSEKKTGKKKKQEHH